MDYEQILFEVSDAVATVTLNRPERLNAWTARMGEELRDAFRIADERDDIRVVVVTGAGRGFCAGADLSGGGQVFRDARARETAAGGQPLPRKGPWPWEIRKPIIAAINGPAVGAGATLPLQWDIRIAAESARIGFVFVRRGLTPEEAVSWTLPRLVGMARAAELLYTGRMLTAREALEFGIVSRVVPDAELLPVAHGLAREIATGTSAVSMALTKRLLWHGMREPDPVRARTVEAKVFGWATQQADAREGIACFLEKRPPRFPMRASTDIPEFDELK